MPTRTALVFAPGAGLAGLTGLLMALGLAATAHAAEFCVRCSGPDQTYRCKVTGVGPQYSDAAKLFCVLRTTKTEGHAKCTATLDPACNGIEKVYAYNGPALPDAIDGNSNVHKYKQRMAREQQKFADPEEARPTLFGLGKGMIDGTKARFGYGSDESRQPAAPPPQVTAPEATAPTPAPQAEAVSPASGQRYSAAAAKARAPASEESFARRSYRCLKSFFFNCGSRGAAN